MGSLRNVIYRAAWPLFACQDCIGMIHYGCQCAIYEAVAPGVEPSRRHRFLRRLYNYAWNNSLSEKLIWSEQFRSFTP